MHIFTYYISLIFPMKALSLPAAPLPFSSCLPYPAYDSLILCLPSLSSPSLSISLHLCLPTSMSPSFSVPMSSYISVSLHLCVPASQSFYLSILSVSLLLRHSTSLSLLFNPFSPTPLSLSIIFFLFFSPIQFLLFRN